MNSPASSKRPTTSTNRDDGESREKRAHWRTLMPTNDEPPVDVFISGVCVSGEFGDAAGCGVYWDAADERNRSFPVGGRASETRAILQALSVALEQALEAGTKRLLVHTTSTYVEHTLLNDIRQGRKNGWLTMKNKAFNELDLMKKVHQQLHQEIEVSFRLTQPSDATMKETEELANCGLEVAKCLWAHAKKVYTSAVVRTTPSGQVVAGYGTFWDAKFLKPAVACLDGATQERALLKAISVALLQAVNSELDRVVLFVESKDVIKALNEYILTWKSNNWTAEDDIPAAENVDLLLEIDAKREVLQVAFKYLSHDDNKPEVKEIIEQELSEEISLRNQ